MLAMLGYAITTTGEKNPVLYREDFCGCCGSQHPNPDMLDMYNVCYACFNTLREPSALRKRFANIVPNAPSMYSMQRTATLSFVSYRMT